MQKTKYIWPLHILLPIIESFQSNYHESSIEAICDVRTFLPKRERSIKNTANILHCKYKHKSAYTYATYLHRFLNISVCANCLHLLIYSISTTVFLHRKLKIGSVWHKCIVCRLWYMISNKDVLMVKMLIWTFVTWFLWELNESIVHNWFWIVSIDTDYNQINLEWILIIYIRFINNSI